MGFNMLFYIIFGNNLLTRGPVPVSVFFCLFQSFAEKEYQTESKQNTPRRLGVQVRRATRWPQGWRARPQPCGPLGDPLTQIFLLYILLYPKNFQGSHKTTFPPPQPSEPMRSHLGAFFDDLSEGESIMVGFYINTIASPMKREQFTTDLRVHSYQQMVLLSL